MTLAEVEHQALLARVEDDRTSRSRANALAEVLLAAMKGRRR